VESLNQERFLGKDSGGRHVLGSDDDFSNGFIVAILSNSIIQNAPYIGELHFKLRKRDSSFSRSSCKYLPIRDMEAQRSFIQFAHISIFISKVPGSTF
jgi:hypothetical protein